ncbi:hypothetical protein AVEN_60255-1 [Araneus ventricosus]|uniref:Uncharacterized protein n=1 Tax=Araneus ventricosus TaxID=182803 RepID=A0A4Y2D0I1_ARAVE|nr:hypothetical protein AVEN_60255-1 [Araneus ventricosus]
MAADNLVISKMQQLLHWCFNVRRSAILHKNCAIHTSALLQCWNELVTQKKFMTCPIDCTGYRTRRTNLLGKERANDKCCLKPAPHSHLLRMKSQWLHLKFVRCNCRTVTVLVKKLHKQSPSCNDRVMTTFSDAE